MIRVMPSPLPRKKWNIVALGVVVLPPSAVIVAAASLAGCTTSIIPPADPADPVSVVVLDYGRHYRLLLPCTSAQALTDNSYGDLHWCAFVRH